MLCSYSNWDHIQVYRIHINRRRTASWKRFWNKQLEPNQDQTDATLVCIFRRTDVKRGSKIIQSSRPIHITATVLIRETNRLLETDETRRVVGQISGYITTTTASSVISDIPLDSVQQIVVVLTPSRIRVLLDVVIDVPLTDIAQSKLRSKVTAFFHTTNATHIKEWMKTHSSQLTNCDYNRYRFWKDITQTAWLHMIVKEFITAPCARIVKRLVYRGYRILMKWWSGMWRERAEHDNVWKRQETMRNA